MDAPLSVAGQCRDELRGVLRFVNDVGLHRGYLPAAKFNHGLMLSRAALVSNTFRTGADCLSAHRRDADDHGRDRAHDADRAVWRGWQSEGRRRQDIAGGLSRHVRPDADQIGAADAILDSGLDPSRNSRAGRRQLINTAVFTSVAELREAMIEARRTIVGLINATDRWIELLRNSDRVMFEFDRDAWMQAYANVGSDVVELMQDPDEAGDEDENEPASPRWCALEEMRAKSK